MRRRRQAVLWSVCVICAGLCSHFTMWFPTVCLAERSQTCVSLKWWRSFESFLSCCSFALFASLSSTFLPRQRANQQTFSVLTGRPHYQAIDVRSHYRPVQNMVNILPTTPSLEVCMFMSFLCISMQLPPHAVIAPSLFFQVYIRFWCRPFSFPLISVCCV